MKPQKDTAFDTYAPGSSPAVSVIVPIYNAGDLLADTITSVLDQTYSDFELILVDDGSTDHSAMVCRTFTDPRIRYFWQNNAGVSAARNSGLAMARGAFIGFIDSDDLWHEDKIAAHMAHFEARPNVGVSYSACQFINKQGALLNTRFRPKMTGITAADVYSRNPIAGGSSAFFRRSVFNEIIEPASGDGCRDYFYTEESAPGLSLAEDHQCWLRIALHSELQFEGVDRFLTCYRIHDEGLSANIPAMNKGWEAIDAYVERVAPELHKMHSARANAYQMRYYARRAIAMKNGALALSYVRKSLGHSLEPFWREPTKSLTTLGAATLMCVMPKLGGRLLGDNLSSKSGDEAWVA